MGTLNVMEAARQAQCSRIIHTSTSEVYGTARSVPMRESHPLQGQSPYSASKIGADKIAESYQRAFGVPVVTIRPFNTYGPRQSARAVIPTIITQVLMSDNIRLGALNPIRDFTYVRDTVHGFLSAAETDVPLGLTVNLGNDSEISVGELAEIVMILVGRRVPIVCQEQRLRPPNSEVDRLHADITLGRQVLNWKPSVPLEEGLTETIAWIKNNLDSYRIGEYQI